MTIYLLQQGDHRLLCDERTKNVVQVGRTRAEQLICELRRHGHHPYPLRFAPTIYNVGVADSRARASALQDLFNLQRAAIRRILAASAPEVVP
jgi:hypothetical protein